MKAKLPVIALAIAASLLVVGLASCHKDTVVDVSALAFEPSTISLEEGASCQLQLQGVPEGASVRYSSADPSIATVDAESGVVLAISEGETKISARVASKEIECKVVVTKLNEMPLLIFNPKVDGGKLVDERILVHEKLCGRQYTDAVPLNTQIYTFPGFYNEKLKTVTCVIYDRHYKEVDEDMIVAYCTEPITNLEKVKTLLAPLGFTRFEARKFTGSEEVYIYNARSFIHFVWERKNAIPRKYHPVIANVKDFPSLEAASEGKEKIKEYEEQLGFRKHDGYDEGYRFIMQDDKMDSSNIGYSDYQNGDEVMGTSILSRMLCVKGQEDILSQELKDYLTYNGYGIGFQYLFSDTGLLGFNQKGDACLVFIESTQGVCWMYLIKEGHHSYSPKVLSFVRKHSLCTPEDLIKLQTILK